MRALSRAISAPPAVDSVPTSSPMAGLKWRAVGLVDVLAQSAGAVAPTAAAASIPALVVGQASGSSPLLCMVVAWLLAGGVCAAVSQFTRRMRAPGSLYTFTTKGLGPHAGFAAAVALLIGYGFVAMFSLVGAGMYAQNLVSTAGVPAGGWGAAAGVVLFGAVCFVVLRRGIRISARVTLVVELVAVALMLTLLAIVLPRADPAAFLRPITAGVSGPGHLAAGTAVAMTAFVGFESAAALGREARRPFFAIPRTMRWVVVAVGFTYVASMYIQQVGAESFGFPLANDDLAMTQLAAHSGVPRMGRLLELGQATSLVACAIASLTAFSRVVFTLGREGVLPAAAGWTDPLLGTPLVALAVAVPATVAVPLLLLVGLGWTPWHAMSVLIVVSAVGYLTAYTLVCAAVPAFLHRIGELTPRTGILAGGVAAVLAAVVGVYLAVIAHTQSLALWLVLASGALGLGLYAWLRRRRPACLAGMGLFDETTVADLLSAQPIQDAGRV
jgi:amino acid transporter